MKDIEEGVTEKVRESVCAYVQPTPESLLAHVLVCVFLLVLNF